jgi:hypothetical protein
MLADMYYHFLFLFQGYYYGSRKRQVYRQAQKGRREGHRRAKGR